MVMVLATTNCPWDLDAALLRRLEKRIYIPLPDMVARVELFRLSLRGVEVDAAVDLAALATATEGFSASDVRVVCREACMSPLRRMLLGRSPQDLHVMKANGDMQLSKVRNFDKW